MVQGLCYKVVSHILHRNLREFGLHRLEVGTGMKIVTTVKKTTINVSMVLDHN